MVKLIPLNEYIQLLPLGYDCIMIYGDLMLNSEILTEGEKSTEC